MSGNVTGRPKVFSRTGFALWQSFRFVSAKPPSVIAKLLEARSDDRPGLRTPQYQISVQVFPTDTGTYAFRVDRVIGRSLRVQVQGTVSADENDESMIVGVAGISKLTIYVLWFFLLTFVIIPGFFGILVLVPIWMIATMLSLVSCAVGKTRLLQVIYDTAITT